MPPPATRHPVILTSVLRAKRCKDEEEKERKRREFKAKRAAHYGGMGHGVSGEGGERPMSEGERMKMMRAKMMEEDE